MMINLCAGLRRDGVTGKVLVIQKVFSQYTEGKKMTRFSSLNRHEINHTIRFWEHMTDVIRHRHRFTEDDSYGGKSGARG